VTILRRFAGGFLLLLLVASAARGNVMRDYEARFTKYFMDRVQAKSILPVLSASEDDLRRGKVPKLTVCIDEAVVEGVLYDRLLLVMDDVLFTLPARGLGIHSHGECALTGSISKESFLKTLSGRMPHFAVSDLRLKDGEVTVKGVYDRRFTFRVRALMRFTGSYVIERTGRAIIRFDDSTNDNPLINPLDVGRAMANASPVLSFENFFGQTSVREVRVDHDMVWFSAK
jgi:hypothetical protein